MKTVMCYTAGQTTKGAVAASAVATQEATDEDSNVLRGKTVRENAVAIRKAHMFANDWRIRKPAGAGNGYRVLEGPLRKYESPVPPLCGDTGLQKRLKVFSGSA